MTPRPQLDEDQMARMVDEHAKLRKMSETLEWAAHLFREIAWETAARKCEDALK